MSLLDSLREQWMNAWPDAVAAWSRYVQLSPPIFCTTKDEEKKENLTGSFAMIRLVDHAVVVSLRQVVDEKIERFSKEILAHEIGHHVYCPADLADHARVIARTRRGIPGMESQAGMIANLYTDLLINDRLQRSVGLDMAGVYQAINKESESSLWRLYMRIYEILWSLPRGSLALGKIDERMNIDADLGARLIRSYAREWLDGAGRFACLCFRYLEEDEKKKKPLKLIWGDTANAGEGGIPSGLTELDDDEIAGAIHPSEDEELSGIAGEVNEVSGDASLKKAKVTGFKGMQSIRSPIEYLDVLKAAGSTLTQAEIVARYYRELAMPYLIPFPMRELAQSKEHIPEGLETWDVGDTLDAVDWLGTVSSSPHVIPGVTTRQRIHGETPGNDPEKEPIDLYLGVDCSGSMGNPAGALSYPILAGAIMLLSALRTGSRVMVALSGEPGRTITTDGFVRDELLALRTLTDYLGTGTTFGIHRLADTFATRSKSARPVHILILTDGDIFGMLDQTEKAGKAGKTGWTIADESLAQARAGGTMLLQIPESSTDHSFYKDRYAKLKSSEWTIAHVASQEELITFAKKFSEEWATRTK